jgi:hypothetical protein
MIALTERIAPTIAIAIIAPIFRTPSSCGF